MTRLLLLNGLPGVGKSTLAERTGARLVHVVLVDPSDTLTESARSGDDPARGDLRGPGGDRVLAGYRSGLAEVARLPGVVRLTVRPGDVGATYAALVTLLDRPHPASGLIAPPAH